MTDVHYWRAKFGKDTPWIGVKTFFGAPLVEGEELDRSWRWQALVRNETTGRMILYGEPCPIEVEGVHLRSVERITEQEWKFLVDHSQWATAYAPHLPDAAPRVKIDKRGNSVF
jgi:hypothetical protein